MDKKGLELCLSENLMRDFNVKEAVLALIFEDKTAIESIKKKFEDQKLINKSYVDAFDASTDDHERNAVIGCVRFNEVLRPVEYSQKVADFKSGKIKMEPEHVL
jgi:replicative DNA helicase